MNEQNSIPELPKCRGNSQIFVVLINVMQLQHMRMLDQFQNGYLPLNLVTQKRRIKIKIQKSLKAVITLKHKD